MPKICDLAHLKYKTTCVESYIQLLDYGIVHRFEIHVLLMLFVIRYIYYVYNYYT